MTSTANAVKSILGYEVIGRLGEGAGSLVYVASQGGRRCALKHVVVKEKRDERFVDQLQAEWEVGRKVTHPGLRRLLDLKVTRTWLGRPTEAALLMELVEGEPLDRLSSPPAIVDWIDYFMQTAEALGALHAMGHVHCDLKPGNVMVNPAGKVKVIDLGQACPIGTRKARVQGTPDFISPEQVKCQPVTLRTDVFNMGAMMYTLLSGRKLPTLFTVKTGGNAFLVDSRIDSPHDIDPAIPETLSNLVMDCVRTDPAKRPADMAELAHRLEVILFGVNRRPASGEFRGSAARNVRR